MNRRHLPAVEALENLFDSDSSPIEVENPEEVALTIVQWLIDSGFEIAQADRKGADPVEVLVDLFGSGPEDLHGAMIIDPEGVAELVLDALAERGYQIVLVDH